MEHFGGHKLQLKQGDLWAMGSKFKVMRFYEMDIGVRMSKLKWQVLQDKKYS